MRNNYVVRARKFYDSVYNDICMYEEPCQYIKYFKYWNKEHNRRVIVSFGSTRVCLITSDYVIKIDYNGESYFGNSESEARAYKRACMCGAEDAFCPIRQIADNAWVMPRCRVNDEFDDEDTARYKVEKFYARLSYKESAFIENHIQDIHEGNVGYYNGRIVLIDYACAS